MNQKPSSNRPQGARNAGPSLFVTVKENLTTRQAAELYGLAPDRKGMVCCPFHADKHPSMKVDARFHCFGCGADGDVIDFAARLHGLRPYDAARKLAEDANLSVSHNQLERQRNAHNHNGTPEPPLPGEVALRSNDGEVVQRSTSGRRSSSNLSVSHSLDSHSPFGTFVPPPPTGGVFPSRGALGKEGSSLTPISTVLPRCVPAVLPVYQYKQLLERWQREYAPKSPEELLDLRYCEALHKLPYLIQLTGQLSRLSTAGIRRWILNNRAELDEMERRVAAARGGDAQ